MRILLVDDDPIVRDLLSASLAREGFTDVTLAHSGAHALELIGDQETPFDCYLLDIMMEQMDGIELCREIRQKPEYRAAPIIMITSGQASDFMERAFEAGATDFLMKPLNHIEVAGRLRTAMLLVEATKQKQKGREALRTVISHATDFSLVDPSARIRFSDISGMLDYFELENRFLRLKDGQYQINLCRLQIGEMAHLAETAESPNAIQLVYSISAKIGEIISDQRHWFAYIGAGRFVCCVIGRPSPTSPPLQGLLEDAAYMALHDLGNEKRSGLSVNIKPLTEKRIISRQLALKLIRREYNLLSMSIAAKLPEVDTIEERIFSQIDKVGNR
ncbi:response regulator [Roseovarius sp. S1116L3]|uniref:response regulator n=1 Tax=Roseovarius roseus TaxID=3342636 RepID=UPI003726CC8E